MKENEVKSYKWGSLRNKPPKNAVIYVLNPSKGAVEAFVTDRFGNPVPLSIGGGINIGDYIKTDPNNNIIVEGGKLFVKKYNSGDEFIIVEESTNDYKLRLNDDKIEILDNKQNSLEIDGTGTKYPTVDAVNIAISDIRQELGGGKLHKDIYADVTVGAVNAGDTLSQGMNTTEVFEAIFNKTYYPTFTPYSISGNAGSSVEVGTGTKSITVNFTRGNIVGDLDSGVWNPILVQGNVLGVATKYWIDGDDNGTNPTKSISVLTTLGTNSVNIEVDYAEGDQPEDSKGIPYGSPEPSGTLNGVVTWQGFYYRTAIAGNSAPTATDIRNNYTARRSSAGLINISSGTTNVRFDVFVPQGSSITQVLDTGNLNLNITSEFELQGLDFSGLDANGDEVLYKHYVRIIDNPYAVNSVLEITVT